MKYLKIFEDWRDSEKLLATNSKLGDLFGDNVDTSVISKYFKSEEIINGSITVMRGKLLVNDAESHKVLRNFVKENRCIIHAYWNLPHQFIFSGAFPNSDIQITYKS